MATKQEFGLHLPEALVNVPEKIPLFTYRGPLGRIGLRFTQTEGIIPYLSDEGVIYRDVTHNDLKIGDFDLGYDYDKKRIRVDQISVAEKYQRHGIGTALYRSILRLPLPHGAMPRDVGFYVDSRYGSELAKRRWEALVNIGEAEHLPPEYPEDTRHFIMR